MPIEGKTTGLHFIKIEVRPTGTTTVLYEAYGVQYVYGTVMDVIIRNAIMLAMLVMVMGMITLLVRRMSTLLARPEKLKAGVSV